MLMINRKRKTLFGIEEKHILLRLTVSGQKSKVKVCLVWFIYKKDNLRKNDIFLDPEIKNLNQKGAVEDTKQLQRN